jgi:hypothetical protein
MRRPKAPVDKHIETAVHELLDSRAESRIYIYLLRNRDARSDDIIGKNPYTYQAVSPLVLLQRRVKIIEMRLNKIARLTNVSDEISMFVQITIDQGGEEQP